MSNFLKVGKTIINLDNVTEIKFSTKDEGSKKTGVTFYFAGEDETHFVFDEMQTKELLKLIACRQMQTVM